MKTCLKSNFFLAKILPTSFFCVCIAGMLYPFNPITVSGIIIGGLLMTFFLLNLYLKKNWISMVLGVSFTLIFFYLIFAVLSEYSEFPDGTTFEALRLLIVGLVLCISAITMGILLCIPFKRKCAETDMLSAI